MKNIYVLLKVEAQDFTDIAEVVSEVADQSEADIVDYMWLQDESPYIAY